MVNLLGMLPKNVFTDGVFAVLQIYCDAAMFVSLRHPKSLLIDFFLNGIVLSDTLPIQNLHCSSYIEHIHPLQ